MANPVRLFRLGCSVILLFGLQLTPVAVAVAVALSLSVALAVSTRGRDVDEHVNDEYEGEEEEEDDNYDRDDDNDDNNDDNNRDNNDNNNDNDDDNDNAELNSTITCDHGICRDEQDISVRRNSPRFSGFRRAHTHTHTHKMGAHGFSHTHTACEDLRDDCKTWAADDKCRTHPKYMHPHCPRTCKTCHNRTLRNIPLDQAFSAPLKSQYQFSQTLRRSVKIPIVSVAGADLGVPQIIMDGGPENPPEQQNGTAALDRLNEARDYLRNVIGMQDRYESVRTLCRNQNEACAVWAVAGECEDNPFFMRHNCAPVCFSCQELHVSAKCPLDPDAINAWEPGDLNTMFERIWTDAELLQTHNYTPTVLSRPEYVNGDTEDTATYQTGPWVLVLDDFVSLEETERMIVAGDEIGYARSTDVGDVKADGTFEDVVSTSRTSMNAWCNEPSCEEDPLVKDVIHRIQAITQIPLLNSESLQLLRYTEGQFYKTHHDYIGAEQGSAQGVRILTVFLYLSDVDEGGGTNFPYLDDLTVEPKRGRALLWPSVLDDDPDAYDPRTFHQALPVTAGLKYGANAWFHQRDVVTPTNMGC